MAISWDFTAAAKAQQAGQAAAARDSANLQRSISQGVAAGQRAARAKQLEKERQDRAAQAQQLLLISLIEKLKTLLKYQQEQMVKIIVTLIKYLTTQLINL